MGYISELRYFSKEEKPELFTKSHDDLWDEIWKYKYSIQKHYGEM